MKASTQDKNIKVLHLSTSDIEGGAARAAYRLHQGLNSIDVKSQMLVRAKFSADSTVVQEGKILTKLGPRLSGLPLNFHPKRDLAMFSSQWFLDAIAPKVAQLNPDILDLHWICNGYLQVETLAKFNKPLVWTCHDMWAFTGGCHYSQGCDRYTKSCGTCPHLKSDQNWDVSKWVWQRKYKAWKNLDLTIVAPSKWMGKCAQSSSLFGQRRVEVIPYGIDLQKYKPINKKVARELLNLPQDKQLILFGSMSMGDPRKGNHLLQSALKNLMNSDWQNKLEVLTFGEARPNDRDNFNFKSHYLGMLNDDLSLALVYSAADIFAAPSTEDNLPNTIMEALACGVPCIAFDIGGMPDMIDHQKNGYLAKGFDVNDLAKGINWILEDRDRHQQLSQQARKKAEIEFPLELQAKRYLTLFNEILNK
jgi:glycosyltransferase involved in cell wall biosynthesis